MAEDTEIFGVELDGRFQRLEKAMLQAANRTDANLNRIEKKFDATNKRLRRGLSFGGFDAGSQRAMRDAERQVQRLAGTLAAAFSAREVASMADEYTALQNRLQVVGLAGQQMAKVQDHLFESATRNGVAVSALGELYGRVALSTKELGVSQADLLRFVDGVTASLRVQGTSTQAASGALLQLGQALGAGTVRAEELNSILEGVPVLAQAAARGMGVSVASLRKSVLDGKVSSEAFFDALMKGFPEVEKQAQASALTIGQALTGLRNELIKYVGQTDDAVEASARVARAINTLAQNLDTILPILTAIGAFFGVRYVAALGAAAAQKAALGLATKGLGASLMALAGGPVGLAVTAVAALTVGLFALAQQNTDAAIAVRALQEVEERAAPAKTKLEKLTRELATASGERAAAIRQEIRALIDLERVELARLGALKAAAEDRAKQSGTEGVSAMFGGEVGTSFQRQVNEQVAREASKPRLPSERPLLDTREVREATALVEAQWKVVDAMEASFREATEEAERFNRASSSGKTDKGEARRAEQRARMLEDLKAQTALEIAQLDQQAALVRELERSAEITARIRSLKDAGVRAAEAERISAEAQAQLDQARARAREREEAQLIRNWDLDIARVDENWASVRAIEEEIERRELVVALAKVSTDQASAEAKAASILASIQSARADAARRALEITREEHRLQVAQLSGNRALTKELQDQAAIRERTARYQQDGRLDKAEAARRATAEVTQERVAATYGEQRELFATAFSDGIRAALSGDLQGFLSNQFGNFADTMMQKAGEQIFDAVFGGVDAMATGTAEGAAHASVVGPAIVTAGAAAGTTMAASIVTAGTAAGAAMAAQIMAASAATSFLPGFSSGGYTGAGGVREPAGVVHRGEVVWSQRDIARSGGVAAVEAMRKGLRGYAGGGAVGRPVIPQATAAASRVQGAGRQPVIVQQHLHNHFEGAVMTEELLRDMDRKAAMAQAGAVAQVASASAEQQRKSIYRTRR